ncbi:MAG: Stk1 family PASTA domain-containing Ser/Thr kinase [Erysipelotrichia bacterium]|nr:Stk1 family PASTA domain-containing Ser/Thr kinase [Erysipelotrichia bacterium]NCC53865.1 Stk1 family PASTA domain-containing Ser/Thr kinase [Erysipelotrichia bacterium]
MSNMIAERYMVVATLGEGGMADVYLAMDTILNREVAVKVLRGELSEDPVALLRFLREASAVSKLHHPNVVEVYDVGEYDHKNYIVMEYIRGRTLKQMILQRGALPKEEAVEIMKQLVSAVNHAHENNIIHRDIKPQNILIKDDGTVKITDFGIALAHDAIQLTQSDAVLGSAHYIAPETTKGEVATIQTDIYALGIVFYELLTGTVPFKGDNPIQVAMKHLREEIPSIRVFNPTLPQSMENIIIKATAKNRINRYANAKDMLFDLEMCLLPEFANVDPVDLEEDDENSGTVVLNRVADLEVNDDTVEMEDDEIERIKKKATNNKKKTHSQTSKNAKNKKITMIIAGAVVAVVAIFAVVAATTGMFDPSNKEEEIVMVKVPNLEGMDEEEASKALAEVNLKLSSNVKQEVTDNIEKGIVIKQSISKNKKVKEGTSIVITISAGKYFVVDNYVGKTLSEVRTLLNGTGIDIVVQEQESEDKSQDGVILSQDSLAAGTKVEPNASKQITFSVGKYKEPEKEMFTLDDYTGKDYQYVRGLLEGKGISVKFIPVNKTSSELTSLGVKDGAILSQDLAAGSTFDLTQSNTITFEYAVLKEKVEDSE